LAMTKKLSDLYTWNIQRKGREREREHQGELPCICNPKESKNSEQLSRRKYGGRRVVQRCVICDEINNTSPRNYVVFRTAGSVAQSCHIPQGGNGNGCSWMSANARFLPPWNFQTRAKRGQRHQCARGLGLKTKILCWRYL